MSLKKKRGGEVKLQNIYAISPSPSWLEYKAYSWDLSLAVQK